MRNLNKLQYYYEVYTELSLEDVFDSICEKVGQDHQGKFSIHQDCIRVERNPSIFESFRGEGVVNFRLSAADNGTTIKCTIEPFTKKFIRNWSLALLSFLLVFTTYVFYLGGMKLIPSTIAIGGWLLTFVMLRNGINHHKNELHSYSRRILTYLDIVYRRAVILPGQSQYLKNP
ncbi:hypothetical protein [Olivibacter domesticus]|uniref:Uncharacterized protein n=1 Tax=Olivibacter domesticus TaxID=407022 RepID=A0A1H7J0D2_OLID1|nr:hypothetical protein [Olivibacter domesticus]SEK68086.1 hypothetical protein SAMN05661044_00882 [Olivibacter domesticus]